MSATVESCGFGPEGLPATPETVTLLSRVGIDVTDHRSRRATRDLLTGTDLIITAERQHVVQLVIDEGADFGSTFTLHELRQRIDSLGSLHVPNLPTALELLNEGRPRGGAYLQSGVPEVFDPTGGSTADWQMAWDAISGGCIRVASFLGRLSP